MAELFKEWVPMDLVGAIQMRREVSMFMHAPGIYVGFLLGRERTWRQAILKVWGRMSPLARYRTSTENGMGWLVVYTLARTTATG